MYIVLLPSTWRWKHPKNAEQISKPEIKDTLNYLYIVCSLVIIGLHGPPPAIPRLAKQTNIMQIIPLHCEPVMSNQIRNKTKSFCYKDCWSKVSWKISAQAYHYFQNVNIGTNLNNRDKLQRLKSYKLCLLKI